MPWRVSRHLRSRQNRRMTSPVDQNQFDRSQPDDVVIVG